jgi:hypothetical protein
MATKCDQFYKQPMQYTDNCDLWDS